MSGITIWSSSSLQPILLASKTIKALLVYKADSTSALHSRRCLRRQGGIRLCGSTGMSGRSKLMLQLQGAVWLISVRVVSDDLGNRGKVLQVLGTSQSDRISRLSFHNSEVEAEVRRGKT